ncbi:TRAFs-binding domain-containing protein [Nocardia sp. NPDC004068]|uniref:TRAFs-binding domain-containing protein n=1 Tax=Nocardia sp. NPDC004068 TaxID=3364303 RepID=UPI00368AAC97
MEFDEVYRQIIKPAVSAASMTCIRADEDEIAAIIHKSMFERLMLCPYAVADLTMANANVFYELGIRHAMRPWSTVLVCAETFGLPFDLKPMPVIRYRVDDKGKPVADPDIHATLVERLDKSRKRSVDSPLFDLFPALPQADTSAMNTDAFRGRMQQSERLQQRLMAGRTLTDIERVRAELGDLGDHDDGVLIALLLAYRRLRHYEAMITTIATMPDHLTATALVRGLRAFAHNRIEPGSVEAEAELVQLDREFGPDGEILGLLGRVYKDRWLKDPTSRRGEAMRTKALSTYQRGFEADWRNPYPGINAVHLMWMHDRTDPRLAELLPVVEYSTRRRVDGGSGDYWDLATMLEICLYRDDLPGALRWLNRVLETEPRSMEAETTLQTILRIRERLGGDGTEWATLIAEFHSIAQPSPRKPT